jgi:hypothetical protein
VSSGGEGASAAGLGVITQVLGKALAGHGRLSSWSALLHGPKRTRSAGTASVLRRMGLDRRLAPQYAAQYAARAARLPPRVRAQAVGYASGLSLPDPGRLYATAPDGISSVYAPGGTLAGIGGPIGRPPIPGLWGALAWFASLAFDTLLSRLLRTSAPTGTGGITNVYLPGGSAGYPDRGGAGYPDFGGVGAPNMPSVPSLVSGDYYGSGPGFDLGDVFGPNSWFSPVVPGGMPGGFPFPTVPGSPYPVGSGAGQMAPGGACATTPFRPGASLSARAVPFMLPNPLSGQPVWFLPAGRPLLWSGDLRACKRVSKIAGRAARFSRRRTTRRRRGGR